MERSSKLFLRKDIAESSETVSEAFAERNFLRGGDCPPSETYHRTVIIHICGKYIYMCV